jgi:NADPH2:quinone reductase
VARGEVSGRAVSGRLVFIPGLLDDAALWCCVIDRLALPDWQSVPVNLRGTGRAEPTPRGATLEVYRDQVLAELDALDRKSGRPVVVVGHSMGAQVTELVRSTLATPPQTALEALHAWTSGHSLSSRSCIVTAPTRVIASDDSFASRELVRDAVASRFRHAQTAYVRGAGHWPHLEQPEAVAAILTRFVGRIERSLATTTQRTGGKPMKAIQFARHGEPKDVLEATDQPLPEPGEDQVRVRVLLSPVNPSDLLYVRGHYSGVTPSFPAPVGFEGVGVVDALGPGVQNFTVGQRVFARNSRGGNWADYAVIPEAQAFPAPEGIPDEQVASFLINPASAVLMVRHVLRVPRGEWLLQSAANSELGRMIIRLAHRDDIRTVNVVRRKEAAAELEVLGADAVIVSTDAPIDEQVREIVGAEGVRYAIDPVAGQTGTEIFRSLHQDGRMLVYGSLTGEAIRVGEDPRFTLSGRRTLEVYWLGYWLPRLDDSGFYPRGAPATVQLIDEVTELMREGVLATSPGTKYPLDEIHAAVTETESAHSGKVLLDPSQPR